MVATVVVTAMATLAVCICIAGVAFVVATRDAATETEPERPANDAREALLEVFGARLADVETQVKGLPSLWEDERERARKHADRAAAAYRGAEEILDSLTDGGEEDEEDGDLPGFDGEGVGLMRPVLGHVAGAEERALAQSDLRERARRHIQSVG